MNTVKKKWVSFCLAFVVLMGTFSGSIRAAADAGNRQQSVTDVIEQKEDSTAETGENADTEKEAAQDSTQIPQEEGTETPNSEITEEGAETPNSETTEEGAEIPNETTPSSVPMTDLAAATPIAAPLAVDENSVCKIGEQGYAALDEAVKAAKDGETIEILKDCTTEAGLNLNKNLMIKGAASTQKPTITFTQYGIALWAKSVTFENVNVEMNHIGSTPYYQEWGWMTICGQAGSEIKLIDADMTLDGQGLNKHAIYADNGLRLYMERANLVVRNYGQDALEWNGGRYDYNVEMIDSTYLSDHNRSGFTGTFKVKATNSKIDVVNSSGNGSNGSNFYFDNSEVNFSNNGSHGLSATVLESNNTPITANNNGRWGIVANRVQFVDCKGESFIQANNNGYDGFRVAYAKSFANAPSTFYAVNTDMEFIHNGYWKPNDIWSGVNLKNVAANIDKDCSLMIKESPNTGLRVNGNNSVVNIEEGAEVTIVENNSGYVNGGGQGLGGGVRVETSCRLTLPSNAKIYNNHAEKAGDDIYCANGASITFGAVGSDWVLDNSENMYRSDAVRCSDKIDCWYEDSAGAYWNAHENTAYPIHLKAFTEHYDQNKNIVNPTVTVTGELFLKAAHGINPTPNPVIPEEPSVKPEWKHSKSKTATNLDENFESKVTLSLPSAEEQLESDIVFVLDKSTSADLENQALSMLKNLQGQIQNSGAKVKVGVVIFNKEAHQSGFFDLATEYDNIEAAIKQEIKSGTNTHAGLLAGKAMLDSDTAVDASRKYLIFVSDGISYLYNAEPTVTAWNGIVDNAHLGDNAFWRNWAGPDNWKVKYGEQTYIPENWAEWLGIVGEKIQKQGTEYEYPYEGTPVKETPKKAAEYKNYAMSVDKALYLSYQEYQSAEKAGYHCYSMPAQGASGSEYPWGPSFMKYLADGKEVSFDSIQNEIIYFLDAGSKVMDVIGCGNDNHGNDYNMNFVQGKENLTLTVGDVTYETVDLSNEKTGNETALYAFKNTSKPEIMSERFEYEFVLHYYANGVDGKSDECFVWDINVPVTNFNHVQLTYKVKLENPQTADGVYGEYDKDGSRHLTALYTNKEAVLYPVDSNGNAGTPEFFQKPTVSYEVKNEKPVPPVIPDPDSTPNRPITPPDDPDDRPIYVPDKPHKKPSKKPVEIEETPSAEKPKKDNPETGSVNHIAGAAVLAAASLCGVALLRKKH